MIGQCLCGAVSLSAPDAHDVSVCHCNTCRRWSGAPMMAVNCGPAVDINGQEHIATYVSSAWAERGFCSRCGTHLFYKLTPSGDYFVPAGLLAQDEQVFKQQIYIDKKPSFYSFANDTPTLTEAQMLAALKPPGDFASNGQSDGPLNDLTSP